jgi:hypothetical protein
MDPEFEALVLSDEAALMRVFSFQRRPSGWPMLPPDPSRSPKSVLAEVVKVNRRHGPNYLRMSFQSNPHGWAREVVRNASSASPLWQHPIATRLQTLLV